MKTTVFLVSFTFPPMSLGSILHRSFVKFQVSEPYKLQCSYYFDIIFPEYVEQRV